MGSYLIKKLIKKLPLRLDYTRSLLLNIVALLLLSSCGFRPVYKKETGGSYEILQKIELSPINSVEGAEFYNQLRNIFPHSLTSDYRLESHLSFSQAFTILQKNSDVLRETLKVQVTYSLREKATDSVITSGAFSRLSSYNTTFSPYNNAIKKQDILKNMAIASAEEVRSRIILYLENNKK